MIINASLIFYFHSKLKAITINAILMKFIPIIRYFHPLLDHPLSLQSLSELDFVL